MRETEGRAIERERSEFTDEALEQFREVCAAGACVPAAMVAVSLAPGGGWKLHVATITDGPVPEVDVLRALGGHLADLIRDLRAEDAKEKGGGK